MSFSRTELCGLSQNSPFGNAFKVLAKALYGADFLHIGQSGSQLAVSEQKPVAHPLKTSSLYAKQLGKTRFEVPRCKPHAKKNLSKVITELWGGGFSS